MSFKAIDGVHYIFDRYAFLNDIMADGHHPERLDTESTEEEIKTVIRKARALHHPDRQAAAGERNKKDAERKTHLIADCERFLLNAEIKPLYDERLAAFKKDKPSTISRDGGEIIDLSLTHFSTDALLSEEIVDTSAFEAMVKEITQYNEDDTTKAQTLFQQMPDNPTVRGIYRDALTKKYIYLGFLEDAAWERIGYNRPGSKTDDHVLSADEYAAKVEKALARAKDEDIRAHLQERGGVARIGMGDLPLLLTFNDASGPVEKPVIAQAIADPAMLAEALERLEYKAKENFEIRASYVREIAAAKQEVLVKLTELTPVEALNEHNASSPIYHFYLVNPDEEGRVLARFDIDARTGNMSIGKKFMQEVLTKDMLAAAELTENSFMVTRNVELTDEMVEVRAAGERVYLKVKGNFSTPLGASAKTHPQPPAA